MAADEITEEYATAMEEAIESATKAEAERDAALARVAELEAKYEPPRPAGNTPIRIVSGRAYLVKVYTKDGNFWLSRVAGSIHSIGCGPIPGDSDFRAAMYQFQPYYTGDCDMLFVNRADMIEFEGDAPHTPTFIHSRGFIEFVARRELSDTDEFEDDEPGAPYPTQ